MEEERGSPTLYFSPEKYLKDLTTPSTSTRLVSQNDHSSRNALNSGNLTLIFKSVVSSCAKIRCFSMLVQHNYPFP